MGAWQRLSRAAQYRQHKQLPIEVPLGDNSAAWQKFASDESNLSANVCHTHATAFTKNNGNHPTYFHDNDKYEEFNRLSHCPVLYPRRRRQTPRTSRRVDALAGRDLCGRFRQNGLSNIGVVPPRDVVGLQVCGEHRPQNREYSKIENDHDLSGRWALLCTLQKCSRL